MVADTPLTTTAMRLVRGECDHAADQVARRVDWDIDESGWMNTRRTTGQPEAANSEWTADVNDPSKVKPVSHISEAKFYCAPYDTKYTTLRTILDAAFDHAAVGKGKQRHARDLPFDEQPMLETTRLVGPGFPLGQAIKKAGEAAGMIERGELGAAEAECLGAINYLAGAVVWMRERAEGRVAA